MQCEQLENPWAPQSKLFAVQQTPTAGRGVFATVDIPAGTVLLEAADLNTSTIYREYRKEVCAYCFAYDRGVSWPVREVGAGFVFCTEQCHLAWRKLLGEHGVAAHEAIEALFKRKQQQSAENVDTDEQTPTLQRVEAAWTVASAQGALIISARRSARPSKQQKRELQSALQAPAASSVLPYLLSGILTAAMLPEDRW